MSTMTPCNCGCQTTPGSSSSERPRYYAGQLITPEDMTLEQDYFRARMRRHNRFLHGWGVVCGATVVPSNQPWKVIVKAGYILGPYGDEIYIEKDQCVDVRVSCTPSVSITDGCQEQQPTPASDAVQYVAVQYVEKPTRLVRAPIGGCGCHSDACEYTRLCDSYQICILEDCPNNVDPVRLNLGTGPAPACLACPTDPWVPLASFTTDANGVVTVQPCDCRRQALGFGQFWWNCNTSNGRDNTPAPQPEPARPQ